MYARAIVVAAVGVALIAAGLWFFGTRDAPTTAYAAPGMEALTPDDAYAQAHRLAPALLLVVYDAFGRTNEDEIYDTLATVADGEALKGLYLERAGAMAGGGLDGSDQTVHELKLTGMTTRRDGAALEMDATWEVVGIVGHAEHQHVRGNTYRARLTVAPVDSRWKVTRFDLLDVVRNADAPPQAT